MKFEPKSDSAHLICFCIINSAHKRRGCAESTRSHLGVKADMNDCEEGAFHNCSSPIAQSFVILRK